MNKKIITGLALLGIVAAPMLAFAAAPDRPTGGIGDIDDLYDKVANLMWKIFAIIALVMFVIAGILFLTAQGDPTKVATARQFVLYGIIGIVVAILAYSIITIVGSFFATP